MNRVIWTAAITAGLVCLFTPLCLLSLIYFASACSVAREDTALRQEYRARYLFQRSHPPATLAPLLGLDAQNWYAGPMREWLQERDGLLRQVDWKTAQGDPVPEDRDPLLVYRPSWGGLIRLSWSPEDYRDGNDPRQ